MEANNVIHQLAIRVGERLCEERLLLVTAESCTGGMVAAAITDIAGSSGWFERGFVTYSNQSKTEMVGVPAALIDQYGAVSKAVAGAMAEGALRHSRADIALAITGIAGPGGGSEDRPVGTVSFAWSSGAHTINKTLHLQGGRRQVRLLATAYALRGVLTLIQARQS